MIRDIVIVPSPRKTEFDDGEFYLKQEQVISIPIQDKETVFTIAKRLKEIIKSDTNLELAICLGGNTEAEGLIFDKCQLISDEGYSIEINKNQIKIKYGNASGAFHAVSTLNRLSSSVERKYLV